MPRKSVRHAPLEVKTEGKVAEQVQIACTVPTTERTLQRPQFEEERPEVDLDYARFLAQIEEEIPYVDPDYGRFLAEMDEGRPYVDPDYARFLTEIEDERPYVDPDHARFLAEIDDTDGVHEGVFVEEWLAAPANGEEVVINPQQEEVAHKQLEGRKERGRRRNN